jgi:hypothetical protein
MTRDSIAAGGGGFNGPACFAGCYRAYARPAHLRRATAPFFKNEGFSEPRGRLAAAISPAA